MSAVGPLKVGELVDHFEILQRIGEGGMGEVYLAHDNQLRRKVALKLVIPNKSDSQELIDRFILEARTIAGIDHQNVVRLYSLGRRGVSFYLVIEYIEGQPLYDIIKERKIGVREAVEYLIQICRGLTACHEQGVIHRDIKPQNILVKTDGTVKIVDFGIAKSLDSAKRMQLTQENIIIGTPTYLAPEIIKGAEPSSQSDIFATGITFYYMLTGRLPFNGKNQMALLDAIRNQPVEFTEEEHERIPSLFIDIVCKMLEKSPEDRFSSCEEILSLLDELPLSQLEGERPEEIIRNYDIVNEPALQLKLMQKGFSRREAQKLLDRAAEEALKLQVSVGGVVDEDATIPLSEANEAVSGPISIPNDLLEKVVKEHQDAKKQQEKEKKKTSLLSKVGRSRTSGIFATRSKTAMTEAKQNSQNSGVIEKGWGMTQSIALLAILVCIGFLYAFFEKPFYHELRFELFVGAYLGLALSSAGLFRNVILKTSLPFLMVNIVFISWLSQEAPIKNPEKFEARFIQHFEAYEGFSTDPSDMFALPKNELLRRALARTYLEEALKNGIPYYLRVAFRVQFDDEYFKDMLLGRNDHTTVFRPNFRMTDLFRRDDLKKSDFVFDKETEVLAFYLGQFRWLINDPESMTLKQFKMPFRDLPIYKSKNSIIRFSFTRNPQLKRSHVIQRELSSVSDAEQAVVITDNGKPIEGKKQSIKEIPMMKVRASKKRN